MARSSFAVLVGCLFASRWATALVPIAVHEGKPNGASCHSVPRSERTDNARSGMIPWAFEDGMGFETLGRLRPWTVPMYFVQARRTYIDVAGSSFRAFFEGRNK